MDKNSIIGLVLIGVIIFGFTWMQSRQYKKQTEIQWQKDSVAMVQAKIQAYEDSIKQAKVDSLVAAGDSAAIAAIAPKAVTYKDSLLDMASASEAALVTLANDKVEVVLTTKGAQPYSVKVKDYKTYSGEDLYIIPEGAGRLGINLYAGQYINTSDFVFNVAESDDSTVVMRLPFSGGGYIEQKYTLAAGSYEVENQLSFVGMSNVIPANVSSLDLDFGVVIPRLEKGYKNEKQYSKLDYYFSGDKKPEELGRGRDGDKRISNKVKWFAFQQQFFSVIMTAEDEFASGDFGIKFFNEDDPSANLMTCTARMRSEFQHSDNVSIKYRYFFGPNHFHTLKEMDNCYEKIIPLGGSLVGWISRFIIIPCFNFLHRFIGNFGLIILIMTILLKVVISPLTTKSYSSSAKMQALKPEMDAINKKYPKQEDAMKKQQETMNLYKRAGVSPMGGCLPMLLQFPVLWAMFRFFPASIELRQQGFLWADDLSAYDSILDFGFRIPLYGDHISLFALLMAVTMFFYSRMTSGQMSDDPNMKGMKFMSVWMMPIMMLFICNNLSAGLSYYYFLSNLLTMAQTWIIKKWFVKPEKIREKLLATPAKAVQKSKWQMRLEEAQRMQQQQLKNSRKR